MQVTKREVGDVVIVEIGEKRFDASVGPAFKDYVLDLVNSGNSKIVIDLSQVDFVDSSGLGSFVVILKNVGTSGQLAVSNVHGAVMDLFKITRMDKVFSLYDSADDAASAMS